MEANRITPEQMQGPSDCGSTKSEHQDFVADKRKSLEDAMDRFIAALALSARVFRAAKLFKEGGIITPKDRHPASDYIVPHDRIRE